MGQDVAIAIRLLHQPCPPRMLQHVGFFVSVCFQRFSYISAHQRNVCMLQQYAFQEQHGFDWVDLSAPSEAEIRDMAARYGLHEVSIKDCLQPGHLPKFERFEHYRFVIFRVLSETSHPEADDVQELTNRMSIFVNENFVLTVHRQEMPLMEAVCGKYIETGRCGDALSLMTQLLREGLLTYESPGIQLSESLDYYEEKVFLRNRNAPILRSLYYVKRRIDVIRRLLLLSYQIIDEIDEDETSPAYTRDLRDQYIRTQNLFDNLSENTAQLLSAYFSLASHRTNEIMKVLTVFSVFFLPITFIVGFYGMNFKYMPELEWYYGYPAVIGLMLLVSVIIFIWFRRKGWW